MSDEKRVAIVTGSARGIGKAIAKGLAESGVNVVITDIMEEAANNTANELAALGVETLAIKADVSKAADAEMLIKTTVEKFGKVDYLVNNAG